MQQALHVMHEATLSHSGVAHSKVAFYYMYVYGWLIFML